MDLEAQKRAAAARALEFVRSGMRLGLGTGSTAKHFVELLAQRVAAGLDVITVATSEATRSDAERLGIPITSLDETPQLDLTVDGADEIAPDLSLIKGGGGALLRRAKDGHAFVTDGGHWILDAAFERIADPKSLAERLDGIAGVVEHGLFIGLAHAAVVAGSSGVRVIERR